MSLRAPYTFDKLQAEEMEVIQERRGRNGRDLVVTKSRDQVLVTTGLSLSGGGIRSACFNLGVLEGLDRLAYEPPGTPLHATTDASTDKSHLEYFDYISSVSGGSYAAGHLATAMLPPSKSENGDGEEASARLGDVDLTSKTIPGWLWGVGVWFLGVTFQLLKTGSLLVAVLALIAFSMRILDAPAANRFWYVVGLRTDVTRGFLPFWIALGTFLTAYGLQSSKLLGRGRMPWFIYTFLIVTAYLSTVWVMYETVPDEARAELPYDVHYRFLLALTAPIVLLCLRVFWRGLRRWGRTIASQERAGGGSVAMATSWDETEGDQPLQNVLLVPILTALCCLAGLIATGDIRLTPFVESPDGFHNLQARGQWYGEMGDKIFHFALGALGIASMGFLFPKKLFQSARIIEETAAGERGTQTRLRRWGLEPVFRVVVFLCSYGFVLLVVFVVYNLVARENVSGYMDWRESLPSAALHPSEFKGWPEAWEQIAQDAKTPPSNMKPRRREGWGQLAFLLMKARDEAAVVSLVDERKELAEIRLLDSMPWIVRLAPRFMSWGPNQLWEADGYVVNDSHERFYSLLGRADRLQLDVAAQIARDVLSRPDLYKELPPLDKAIPDDAAKPDEIKARKAAWHAYHRKAEDLDALARSTPGKSPAIDAAVANHNREALRLYLPELIRDRGKKQVFAWVVWRQDQWTRLRIFGIAAVMWLLCCAIEVNTYGLQKFYRGHVIDSWVATNQSKSKRRKRTLWLDDEGGTYRGHEYGRGRSPGPAVRRAPLLLINATLEGNRSLGDEPNLSKDVFTFSPIASGSGETNYWPNTESSPDPLNRKTHASSFNRFNNLDVGNMVATSGAFLSPGTIANPALSAILHLLNIQTGYWVRDPQSFQKRTPLESLRFHLGQSLGIDCGEDSRYLLTDGAHVENLGLYVLLRRRCSLIVISDCSQQNRSERPEQRFNSLVQVLQQAGVDGVEIGPFLNSHAYSHWLKTKQVPSKAGGNGCVRTGSIGLDLVRAPDPPKSTNPSSRNGEVAPSNGKCASPNGNCAPSNGSAAGAASCSAHPAPPTNGEDETTTSPYAQEHYVFAQIVYPDETEGLLVYLRPTLTGDEGDGLLHATVGSAFPDDDPVDQFYTPAKMNTYRLLGRHIATRLMHDPVMRAALAEFVNGADQITGELANECASCDCCGDGCEWRLQSRFRSRQPSPTPNPPAPAPDHSAHSRMTLTPHQGRKGSKDLVRE